MSQEQRGGTLMLDCHYKYCSVQLHLLPGIASRSRVCQPYFTSRTVSLKWSSLFSLKFDHSKLAMCPFLPPKTICLELEIATNLVKCFSVRQEPYQRDDNCYVGQRINSQRYRPFRVKSITYGPNWSKSKLNIFRAVRASTWSFNPSVTLMVFLCRHAQRLKGIRQHFQARDILISLLFTRKSDLGWNARFLPCLQPPNNQSQRGEESQQRQLSPWQSLKTFRYPWSFCAMQRS